MFQLWACVTQCYTLYPQHQSTTRKRQNWFLVPCVQDWPEHHIHVNAKHVIVGLFPEYVLSTANWRHWYCL